jgi:hypothetical protein
MNLACIRYKSLSIMNYLEREVLCYNGTYRRPCATIAPETSVSTVLPTLIGDTTHKGLEHELVLFLLGPS